MIARSLRRADLIRDWLPAAIWSAVLIAFSGHSGSGSVTEKILAWVVSPSSRVFDPLHVLIRKSLHVLAYGFLGALDFRAVRGTRTGWTLRWSAIAVGLATLIAAIDETHQSFVPGRTAGVSDVVLDCAAATLAQFLFRRSSGERLS